MADLGNVQETLIIEPLKLYNAFQAAMVRAVKRMVPGCEVRSVTDAAFPVDFIVTRGEMGVRLKASQPEMNLNWMDPMFIDARCRSVARTFDG